MSILHLQFFIYSFLCCVLAQANAINVSEAANDSTKYIEISAITYAGFKHTQVWVIEKNIPIKTGDSVRIDQVFPLLKTIRQEILKTRLYNEANVRISNWEKNQIEINILVEERWYLFPLPYFKLSDRNFNQWWQDYNRDWRRTIFGINLYHNNLTGRSDKAKLSVLGGFNQTLAFSYETPYLNPTKNLGLGIEFYRRRSHDLNFGSSGNKQQFFRGADFIYKITDVGLSLTFQTNTYNIFSLSSTFRLETIADTIRVLNPDYFNTKALSQSLWSLGISWSSDHRDRVIYPLDGWYALATYRLYSGSGSVIQQWNGFAALYKRLNVKWSLSNELYSRISSTPNLPYSLSEGLGYERKLIRGYELYIIDGQNDVLLKNSVRFELLNFEIEKPLIVLKAFDHIPFEIYLTGFIDAGYVADALTLSTNPLNNQWQYSSGIGIDIFSYYDFSFSCYYAINAMGEKGIYLHFNN